MVIVVDSLRPDHLGVLGYSRDTSPFLDSWSKGAALYRNAFTHGTHTRIAMASLFTGVLPTAHRVREVALTPGQGETDALADGFTTWAESLRAAGYETWALSSNPHISNVYGFGQGFSRFWLTSRDSGTAIRDELFSNLRERDRDANAGPLFVYLHFMDVHSPYLPPPPWDTHFPSPKGRLVFANWAPNVTPDDIAYSMAQYDGAIRSLDAILQDVIPAWEARAGREKAVLLVSDHGEEFREHENLGHGNTVFDELARVAFIAKGPRIITGVHEEPVTHVDANRLVLDWGGAAAPKEARGRPISDWGKTEAPLYTESKEWAGYRSGSALLVVHRRRLWKSYYDSALDPGQLRPIADKEKLKALSAAMERLIAGDNELGDRMRAPKHMKANEEVAERLRALGYVSPR